MEIMKTIICYIKRKWWYLTLLLLSSIYVFYYRSDIYQLEKINTTSLIFLIWLILLLLPLFSEMEFLGIKIKKEVDKVKKEVDDDILQLKMQIMDLKISNSVANNIQINNTPLPSEKELEELKKFIPNKKTDKNNDIMDLGVSDESMFLFMVRLNLEKTLTELCEKAGYNGPKSMFRILEFLNRCEIINRNTVEVINQIIQIANRGVHGEIVSSKYIDFIKQALPEIQSTLDEANKLFVYNICPKCKTAAYTWRDICPNCQYQNFD